MNRTTLALVAVLVTACSGGGGSPTAPATGGSSNNNASGAPTQADVTLQTVTQGDGYGYETTTNSFSPGTVTIAKGGSVTWNNATGVLHNVTFSSGGAPQGVPNFTNGSFTRTFNTAGTFTYNCTNHTGMTGTVVVK